MLSRYLSEHQQAHKEWDKYISRAEFAYNTCIHPSTGYTPFFLTHGREARIGSESVLMGHKLTRFTYSAYVQQIVDQMAIAHAYVKDRVNKKAEERDERNNLIVRTAPLFCVGDVVYVYKIFKSDKSAGVMKKLSSPYDGPYTIIKSYNDVSYQVKHSVTNVIEKVHATWMKKINEKYINTNNKNNDNHNSLNSNRSIPPILSPINNNNNNDNNIILRLQPYYLYLYLYCLHL